jgi:hypothetical protein
LSHQNDSVDLTTLKTENQLRGVLISSFMAVTLYKVIQYRNRTLKLFLGFEKKYMSRGQNTCIKPLITKAR